MAEAYDMLLLLLNLSQIRDGSRLTQFFCESMGNVMQGCAFEFGKQDSPQSIDSATQWSIPVQSRMKLFGYLKCSGKLPPKQSVDHALLRNAVSMLALILENRSMQAELEEKAIELSVEVANQTAALKTFFNVAVDMLSVNNSQGHFVQLNQAWEKFLGCPVQQLIGRSFLEYVHPDDIDSTLSAMAELNSQNPVLNFQNRYRSADGSYRWVEWRSTPVGEWTYAIARDVTEERKAQQERDRLIRELERKNNELEQLNFTASHDLKTPLFTIQGYARELSDSLGDSATFEQKSSLDSIYNAATKMGGMLQDLLHVARLGRQGTHLVPIDLQKVLDSVHEVLKGVLTQEGVIWEVKNPLPNVLGNETSLYELFQNLIENAVRYRSPLRALHIEIACESQERNWLISVRDNGIGIEPAHQGNLFGLFQKLEPNSMGSGIGLAIAKRIVEMHGGSISLSSDGLDKGSVFWILLPKMTELMDPEAFSKD